jgi:hypothetical protein
VPVTIFVPVVILPLVTHGVAISVIAEVVSVIVATAGQAQQYSQYQRRRHNYVHLQVSHINLHFQPQALLKQSA